MVEHLNPYERALEDKIAHLETELAHIADAMVTGTNDQTPIAASISKMHNDIAENGELRAKVQELEEFIAQIYNLDLPVDIDELLQENQSDG